MNPLPWSQCKDVWNETCIDSIRNRLNYTVSNSSKVYSSAELYFMWVLVIFVFFCKTYKICRKDILREKDSIHDGIGAPNWELVLCLAFAWIIISLTLIKGVKSSGRASYFLAVFPYVILLILLVRSATLEGALEGMAYFIRPQWDKLLVPKVWYAAVCQVIIRH